MSGENRHAEWCTEHYSDGAEEWCERTVNIGGTEVALSNGDDGLTNLTLWSDGRQQLTADQARGLAAALVEMAEIREQEG